MARRLPDRQPHSDGRAYFDRKVKEGKTKKKPYGRSSIRSGNSVYRQLVSDADRRRK